MITPTSPPPTKERRISSSVFWPDIDPTAIRLHQRIDNTVTPARLRSALIESIASVNNALRAWRQSYEVIGLKSLEEIPAEEIDGTSILVHRYQRAVGCLAKAMLLERLRDFDATGKGERKAEFIADPIDDCRRDHLAALADLVGRPRLTVELI